MLRRKMQILNETHIGKDKKMKLLRAVFGIGLIAAILFSFPLSLPVSAQEERSVDWSRIYFLGESTTAHLRQRGTLLGQYAKSNVFAPDCGTLALSSRTLSQTIRKAGTSEKISIIAAIREKKPPVLLLSFGLNGIAGFHRKEKNYLQLYKELIRKIRVESPDTLLILQTIYPVAKKQATWNFTRPPEEINLWIDSLNERLSELSADEGIPLWDTAALLKDEAGFLKPEFSADGIHLTSAGYDRILRYIAEKTEVSSQ